MEKQASSKRRMRESERIVLENVSPENAFGLVQPHLDDQFQFLAHACDGSLAVGRDESYLRFHMMV